ncbi:sodium-dependent transporter [Intestinibacillus massiliensis]|uniref:sodium-dependent transporter n=1 Tax=Intestinibacillus massiliensis TaxID=1871029 RepID=UPI000B3585B7|nr:sodium-dependent transporter [Intestinibacillus massiliensis]MCB6365991.1 sodium-dependent transporter [Intestinibacillus massiliensis]
MKEREKFGSRLGFILISAGCAIGLGNVWRFPYITGQYGGAAFVLFYLFFLLILGLPIMAMEFAVGRASQKSAARSFHELEPKGTKWHWYSYGAMAGNYLLMMFYTTVGGWMLSYFVKMAKGDFVGLDAAQVGDVFNGMLANPALLVFWMVVVTLLGFAVCSRGLKNGVEKITKVMMVCLLALMVVLVFRSVTLDGAADGLSFYLKPDFGKMVEAGAGEVIFAAMGQAFFTLSLGIGAMAIFGSYIDKKHTLTGEAVSVTVLDTFVAIMAGLIIFPACAAFGVQPDSGPGLVFVTLPNIFNAMPGGRLWGALFFVFMSFAALSTIIAVFENILSFGMDLWGWTRKKAVLVNIVAIILLSLPCALGFNVLSGAAIPAIGNIQDIEDFIVSNNLLPLGSMVYLLFCTSKHGWGFKNFLAEADEGRGIKFPRWTRVYVSYILPVIVLVIWVIGYIQKFAK